MVWIWLDRYRICEIILRTFLRRCAKRLSLSFNPQMGMVIWSFWAWKRLKTCNLKVRFTSSCKRPSEKQSWQISDIPPKMYWKRWKSLLEGSRVYKLEYLLVAQRDMVEIVRYISGKLQKPDEAWVSKNLSSEFFDVLLGGRRKEAGDSRSRNVC